MPKALDHRTSKTYDIKPVDKRGDLDVERIAKREVLVKLKNTKREEKAAQMLARFESHREKTLKEKLIFDIGTNNASVNFKKQEIFRNASVEKNEHPGFERVDGSGEAVEEYETPEAVLEKFRKTFEEKKIETEIADSSESEKEREDEKLKEIQEGQTQEQEQEIQKQEKAEAEKIQSREEDREAIPEEEYEVSGYSVIHANQLLSPDEALEMHFIKIEMPDLEELVVEDERSVTQSKKIAAIEEFTESDAFRKEVDKGRILTRELLEVQDPYIDEQENGANEIQETKKIGKEPETINQEQENIVAEQEKKIDILERESETETGEVEDFEQIVRKNTKFDESAIDNKLNAWFDCGVVEPTKSSPEGTEKSFIKEKSEENFECKEQEKLKTNKKEIKFTGRIAKPKVKAKKKRKFFSLNYRKKGEAFHWPAFVAKPMLSFMAVSFLAFLAIGSIVFISYGFQIQENVKVRGEQALGYLDDAKNQLQGQDFLSAKTSFASAVKEFEDAQKELDLIGGDMLDIFSTFPILSKISSGKNVVDAGNELTKAAKELSGVIEVLSELENPFVSEEGEAEEPQKSMLEALLVMQEKLKIADESLVQAEKSLALVKTSDLPQEYQTKFQKIQETLPMILSMIDVFEQNSEIFLELLGHNGPRKYLLLFQNNQEMRATGGFIGSYGVMHISNGKIKKFLIEGIYNPDGQLRYNVVPPLPIQKISAGWSTHDANWFPHFPKTAEKIAMFYEYTGGPTVDGIITITPTVLQRMLAITGPIEMEEYDTTVNEENFVEATQYEVEVDYDKTENKPKQFLADLAPKIITELFDARGPEDASKILEIFSDMLKERNIMINSSNKEVQAAISKRGWSGEILQTEKDYLMVINSNINGFKTDGVVDETITHNAKIAEDGTIVDTVKIKRVHNGGDTDYEWWNKVNCDYMRVYVPKGSKFLSVKGQTREINEPILDYEKLGFKRDADVVSEEEGIEIDEETGTRIYEEEGKTVFANWVYVSPKETVEIEYSYELPFKLDMTKNEEAADTYSLLVQKQAGSFGSEFSSKVEYEAGINPIWTYPQGIEGKENALEIKTKLTTDLFFGTVFQK